MASFNGKTPVNFDKIYTPLEVIQKCNRFLVDILINEGAEIDQIIDPAAGRCGVYQYPRSTGRCDDSRQTGILARRHPDFSLLYCCDTLSGG